MSILDNVTSIQTHSGLLVLDWIHTIPRRETMYGRRGFALGSYSQPYEGLFTMPFPGMDISATEAMANIFDYDCAKVIKRQNDGTLEFGQLTVVEDPKSVTPPSLIAQTASDSDGLIESSVFFDPLRGVHNRYDGWIMIEQDTQIPWFAKSQINARALTGVLDGIGSMVKSIARSVTAAYNSLPIKDTYKPGRYVARNGAVAYKGGSDPTYCWTVRDGSEVYDGITWEELLAKLGIDNTPLRPVALDEIAKPEETD